MRNYTARMKRSPKGTTLIELILVSSIMALVGMAVYGAFSLGLSVHNRVKADKPGNDIMVFTERIADDLRNLRPLPEFGFKGDPGRMTFHIHNTRYLVLPIDTVDPAELPVLRVEYEYEPVSDSVVRRSYRYGSAVPHSGVRVLSGVGPVTFGYQKAAFGRAVGKEFEGKAETIPRAVKIQIMGRDQSGVIYGRILDIPISVM